MRKSTSVCPVCLRGIPSARVWRNGAWYQEKTCPEHGAFSAVLWRGSEDIDAWTGELPELGAEEGLRCPEGCGLCADHLRGTCCALLEVTARCNLRCRFCFADGGRGEDDPPLERLKAQIDDLAAKTGGALLQLSGGEPTLRDDLPELVAHAKAAGCAFVQINTNGLRFAADPRYVRALAEAGADIAFLQFDGIRDETYEALRGRALLRVKEAAIDACAENGIGVTLVPTLVPGVNTDQIGALVRYAAARTGAVRGVHFQPVSWFGRVPSPPEDARRYTLGELIDDVVTQTDGLIPRESLVPSACDHPLCGLHGEYVALPGGRIEALTKRGRAVECCGGKAAERNRNYIGSRWSAPEASCCRGDADPASLDGFLAWKRAHGFTLTAMAFQDAGNLDAERLRRCSLHVYRDGKLLPFCAAYLTPFGGTV